MMKKTEKIGIGNICRGIALIILGILVLNIPTGCEGARNDSRIPEESEKTVYSDTQYRMVQGKAVRKPSPVGEREYVYIPLTLHNASGAGIIFSTRVCVRAYALPSGESCAHSSDAAAYGREHIEGFRLFDGLISDGRETSGWLAFDLPKDTESVHIDFATGINEGECISFDCKI